jgi:DNA-directed RNA polymerase subunit RPC12/RpoP
MAIKKDLRAGGEVDSFCTKCRLMLNHRIIAMVGTTPRKVECSTCNSHHLYRSRPPGEKATAAEKAPRAGAGTKEPRAPRVTSMSKARALSESREKSWEQAVLGKAVTAFTRYAVKLNFKQGELVHHTKFGDGVVTRIVDAAKVEIAFKDETRMLAQNLSL